MKKFLLVLALLVAVFILFTQMYSVRSGREPDGTYRVVLVNQKTGTITNILGD